MQNLKCFLRFTSGLQTLGILDEIRKMPDSWHDLFVHVQAKLDAASVENLFKTCHLSEPGNFKYRQERTTISFWRDFLADVEGMI
jgi:hypothetical protein